MNRTYWALALGCNLVVLDSVYYVFDQYLNQHCPAYRFWKMVKTTDACTKQVGSVHRRSSDYCYTTQIDEHNYQEVYASLYGVEWHFPRPDALLLFDMGRDSWTSSFSWSSLNNGFFSQILYLTKEQDWFARIAAVLSKLQ